MLHITPTRSGLMHDCDIKLAKDKGTIFIGNSHQSVRTPQSPIMPLSVRSWSSLYRDIFCKYEHPVWIKQTMKAYRAPYFTVSPTSSEIFKLEATFWMLLKYIYSGIITDEPSEHHPHKHNIQWYYKTAHFSRYNILIKIEFPFTRMCSSSATIMKSSATSYADNHSTVHLATTLWTTIIKNIIA